ncbi:MAG TPA: X2-like carbohydrate binding domain-containing protein [Tenuifilaceae bacterium]|nr:X2-like carbohydrate binding domain-containing protein [Tenuifilaceae bacterium]
MKKTFTLLILFSLCMGLFIARGEEKKQVNAVAPVVTSPLEGTVLKTQSSDAYILSFGFLEDPNAIVNIYYANIAVTIAWDTDITSLTPTMTISEGATVDYQFPTTMDFSDGALFTVTAEDGVTTNYYWVWVNQEYKNPEITPDTQYYGIQEANDLNFTIFWGSESEINQIYCYYWDGNDQNEIPLQEGTDYLIDGNTLTIAGSFMQSLNPEAGDWFNFVASFGEWGYAWFNIVVVESILPHLIPTTLTYDLSNPGDLFTIVIYQSAGAIESVSQGGTTLTEGEDYSLNGTWLFIHNSYLSQALQSVNDEVTLTVTFDTGDEAMLSINTVESNVVNATIDPQSVTYVNEVPLYQDITITWNDASEVTEILVTAIDGWNVDQFEWPYYTVTDNGDGTALLRIIIGDDGKAKLFDTGNAKEDMFSYVTLSISFDVGAPAHFLMTLMVQYFNVDVAIEPANAGWVNGTGDYIVGEEVYLQANPSVGFYFDHWEDGDGNVVSLNNPYVFMMPDHDLELIAVFQATTQMYTVTYSVIGEIGYLYAEAGGNYIGSGQQVTQGWDLVFRAYANWGYGVKEWKINGTIVPNYNANTLVYNNLQSDLDVTVEFMPWDYPEINPDYQFFGIENPQDVEFYINWGSETTIEGITCTIENINDDDDGDGITVTLVEDEDYFINGNILTIASDFILAMNPQPMQVFNLIVEFGSGHNVWIGIVILESTSPGVNPDHLFYDFSNPDDLITIVFYRDANAITSITHEGNALIISDDYFTEGAWLYIHNGFLADNLTAVGDEVELTIQFDTGDEATLTITAIESGVTNATIDPQSVTYYNGMPPYQDIEVTWNDATEITGIYVIVIIDWMTQEMEWPFYDVTDNNDGTARLRVYFDEDKKQLLPKNDNRELEEVYATAIVSFDVGAPAYFLMNIIEERYDVNVSIVPMGAGWVDGGYEYMLGEDVTLTAEANYGYVFQNWRIDGVVVSSDNPYTFIMPNHDVDIAAHFVEESTTLYNLSLAVNPADAGTAMGAGSFPQGENITVVAISNSGYTFVNWTDGEGNVVSTDSPYSFAMPAANITLTANFEYEGIFNVTFAVIDNMGPIEGAVITAEGMDGTLTTNEAGVASHTFADGTYSFLVTHADHVDYTGTFTVSGSDIDVEVTMRLVGVETDALTRLNAYPNPFDGFISFTSSARVSRVVITNLIGQVVLNAHITGNEQMLSTAALHRGVYLVSFHLENGEQVVRRMVKN